MTRERIVGAAVTCFVLAFAGLVGGLVFDRERWPAWSLVNGVAGLVAGARLLQRRFATIRPANDSRSAGEVARDRKFARAWTEAVIVVVALPIIYFVLLLTGGCQMCP